MRIISGKYKGQLLVPFNAENIRPTTDRVKESLFNILYSVEGLRVLDLFSGTGNLGLEAISREAQEVVFVELSKTSISILKKNIDKLKVETGYKILNQNVLDFLKSYRGEPFDIIFADPPFTQAMGHDVVMQADRSKVFGPTTVMAIESAKKEKMDDNYTSLERYDKREFGDKILSFYKKKGI